MPMFKETYEFDKKIYKKKENPIIPKEYKDISEFLISYGFYIYYCSDKMIDFIKDLGEEKLELEHVAIYIDKNKWLYEKEDSPYLPDGVFGTDFEYLKEKVVDSFTDEFLGGSKQ